MKTNAPNDAQILAGRGLTSVQRSGGGYLMFFGSRDVSSCALAANVEGAPPMLSTAEPVAGTPAAVRVRLFTLASNQLDVDRRVHLQVLC